MDKGMGRCLYYKKINFFMVKGWVLDESVERIDLYIDGDILGTARMNQYNEKLCEKYPEHNNSNIGWVYTTVLKDIHPDKEYIITAKFYGKEIYEVRKRLIIDEKNIPSALKTKIGTKNGLTVNDSEEKFLQRFQNQERLPLNRIVIEPSSICNLKCEYCVVSNGSVKIDRGIMSKEVLDKVIEAINQNPNIKHVQLNGLGEPLVNKDFPNILRRLHEETNVSSVHFFTNGMLLDKDMCREIVKVPIKMRIMFSLDGHTALENDSQRKGSNYNIVKSNIEYLLEEIERFGLQQQFDLRINNLILAPQNEEVLVPEYLLKDFGFLRIDSHRAFYFPQLSENPLKKKGVKFHKNPEKRICKRCFNETTIRSNGDVIVCCWDSGCTLTMGNILKNSIEEIWNGEEYTKLREKMRPDVSFDDLPPICKDCHAMNSGYLYKNRSVKGLFKKD